MGKMTNGWVITNGLESLIHQELILYGLRTSEQAQVPKKTDLMDSDTVKLKFKLQTKILPFSMVVSGDQI